MINTIIVDDEPSGIKNLKAILSTYCHDINIIGESASLHDALKIITSLKPSLVFLDIEMPFGTGFDLLDRIPDVNFEIIFVTAFEKYALHALRRSACDYILKPIDINDLVNAVAKAKLRVSKKNETGYLKELLSNAKTQDIDKKIALPTLQGLVFARLNEITHCKADGSYTWFYFIDNRKTLIAKNIGEYDELLKGKEFIRIHHSCLVNSQHIVEYKKGNSPSIVLSNGVSLSVSQRKRDKLMEFIDSQILIR